MAVVALVWLLVPTAPPADRSDTATNLDSVTTSASAVPPVAPASSIGGSGTEGVGAGVSASSLPTGLTTVTESEYVDGRRDSVSEAAAFEIEASGLETESLDDDTTGDAGLDVADAPAPVSVTDTGADEVTAIGELVGSGDVAAASERLDALNPADPRVSAVRRQTDAAWNNAAQQTADQARDLAASGDFGAALALVEEFEPVHGFVESAREDVERLWATDGGALARRALEMAAAGDHDAVVALLEASAPPHATVLAALDELRANPECSEDLPAVQASLAGLTLAAGVPAPGFAESCGGPFRFEIQNALIRFGAGCERASATAYVPVLCEGSTEWKEPGVLQFLLRKSRGSWSITDVAEMDSGAAR